MVADDLVCEKHETSMCSFCLHPGANVKRPKKPTKPSRTKPIKAKVDPETQIAISIIEGVICPKCYTRYIDDGTHGLCHCQRMERLEAERKEISDWYDAMPEAKRKQAGFIGMAALGRASLRAGRSTPTTIANEPVPLVAAVMFEAREQYEMAVKYVASHNTVADEIPV